MYISKVSLVNYRNFENSFFLLHNIDHHALCSAKRPSKRRRLSAWNLLYHII